MTEEKLLWFLDLVDRARQGDSAAKAILLVTLETERKPTILRKLRTGDVRAQDLFDSHHDVVLRVGEKIEQLRSARAYFSWEHRIINDICARHRRIYRAFGEQLETLLTEKNSQYFRSL
jgi:hypothetical protein